MRSNITRNRAALIAILLVGAALRTAQYGATASLSSDEAALALNVTDRGWNELLFRPLMHDQVAPLGFLVLEKSSVGILGDNEIGFRFFPYLLSLVSLILFWRVSTRYLQDPTMLAALIVFALSPPLVLYAGVAKQYSGDVAVCLFLLLMTLRYREGPMSLTDAVVVGLAGGAALLLSQPAVLVASGLMTLLLIEAWRAGKLDRRLLVICAGWCVGAAIVTYVALTTYTASTSEYMESVWKTGFVPRPWLGLAELFWIPVHVAGITTYFVTYINTPRSLPGITLTAIYGVLLLLGILHLGKRDARAAALLAVPVIVALIASAFRLLPISGRITLFVGPFLLIGCFAGFDRIRGWLPARFGRLAAAAALGLAILPGLALQARTPPPRVLGGTLPVLREVKARWQPEDRLAVARGRWAQISMEYYGRRFGIEGWTLLEGRGHTWEQHLRGYLHQVDAFRGAPRAWIYLEGTVPCEDEALLGYLTAIGERIYSVDFEINRLNRVSAHLFDLSDPGLLGKADADVYPVPECSP